MRSRSPGGTSLSAVGAAAVFGFLSFAGFEGAASLGEETANPRREIPRAIRTAVIASGIFYILCILVQTWGFGTDAAGVKAFSTSGSPLGDLAHSYVGSAMSDAINAGATLSAFASGLGAATAGGRILFALARDTPLANLLGRTSTRTGAPAGALTVTLIVGVAAIILQRIAGVSATNAFFYPGTMGVLSLLVAYIVTNVGAINHLFIRARRAPLWELVFPVLGIAFLGYTLYKNVTGQSFPYSRFPLVVVIWLVVGLLIVLFTPRLAEPHRRLAGPRRGPRTVEPTAYARARHDVPPRGQPRAQGLSRHPCRRGAVAGRRRHPGRSSVSGTTSASRPTGWPPPATWRSRPTCTPVADRAV